MYDNFWYGKRVVVTGGNGFLGKHVVRELRNRGAKKIFVPLHNEYDLRSEKDCLSATKGAQVVIHLAGNVGGIGYNMKFPGTLFYDNLMMGVNVLESCRKNLVGKVVMVGTICSYPKLAPVPFRESELWNGYPEETNAPYGIAKKALIVQGMAYRQQYGLNVVNLLPVNLYGPGDHFDPRVSHVIPALIKKFVEAKKQGAKEVTVWGTGKATREFFYVEDAAQAIVDACEKLNTAEPVNIGTGSEISIKDLVEIIKASTKYEGKITWDTTKPDGQPRRMLDTSRAFELFGFKAKTMFSEGLSKTIEWYESSLNENNV